MLAAEKCLDAFDFCSLINVAYQHGTSASDIRAGFPKCGIWPIDRSIMIGESRPEISDINDPLMSLEYVMAFMEARRVVIRT